MSKKTNTNEYQYDMSKVLDQLIDYLNRNSELIASIEIGVDLKRHANYLMLKRALITIERENGEELGKLNNRLTYVHDKLKEIISLSNEPKTL